MGRLSIYEIIFYGDSSPKKPLICKVNEKESMKLKKADKYNGDLELEIIQDGKCDDFVKNTNELLIINEDVKVCMEKNNINNIQYIPIIISNKKFYIINILKIIYNSLDKINSKCMIYPKDFPNEKVRGKIGTIWKIVLKKEKIEGHIFRIDEYLNSIFVDEYLKNLIEDNGFTGIDFNKIELV